MSWVNVLRVVVVGIEVATIAACRGGAGGRGHAPVAPAGRFPASFAPLEQMAQRLARIRSPAVPEIERAIGCRLRSDSEDSRQFWCRDLAAPFHSVDVRLGADGGVVVVNVRPADQATCAGAMERHMGPPDDVEIVSPPAAPASAARWTRKWSNGWLVDGAKIWFSLEERAGIVRLTALSRTF